MAEEPSRLADRLFASVLAPLVLGGAMEPAHPIGARAALALLAAEPRASDAELASRVDLARVVQARRLAPVDRVDDASGAEWALGAAFHDLLQAASPGWVRRSAPKRLLDLARATLDRIPPPRSGHEALTRHTWFARVFELRRKDTAVSWWSGSREYRGKEPPRRLLLWSDLRRVSVARSERGLTDLLGHGGASEHTAAFEAALTQLLRATPLTDFATCIRSAPSFVWTPEALGLARAPVTRILALRAVSLASVDGADADAALGHATRELLGARAWREASTALDFLGHRAMSAAEASASWPGPDAPIRASDERADDTAFARAAGAMVARRWLDDPSMTLPEAERRRLAPIFDAAARTSAAREIALLTAAPRGATPPAA